MRNERGRQGRERYIHNYKSEKKDVKKPTHTLNDDEMKIKYYIYKEHLEHI